MVGSLPALLAAGIALLSSLVSGAGQFMSMDPIEGYRGPIPFGDATINAPLDEDGKETYIGMFSVIRVADFGADQSPYRLQVLPGELHPRDVRGGLHKHDQLQQEAPRQERWLHAMREYIIRPVLRFAVLALKFDPTVEILRRLYLVREQRCPGLVLLHVYEGVRCKSIL